MTNKSVCIFCHQWPVTSALAVLLSRQFVNVPVIPLHTHRQLLEALHDQPESHLVMGLNPHEHVALLYSLRAWLTSRPVLFVARKLYWTDYNLPEFFGIKNSSFAGLDTFCYPQYIETLLTQFLKSTGNDDVKPTDADFTLMESAGTKFDWLLNRVNAWLYLKMSDVGLTRHERQVLLLRSEGSRSVLPDRVASMHKRRALEKTGMDMHLINLYRGVKVRPELQMPTINRKERVQ